MNENVVAHDGRVEAYNDTDINLLLQAGLVRADPELQETFGNDGMTYYSPAGDSTWEQIDAVLAEYWNKQTGVNR